MKTVHIPTNNNPFNVTINNSTYSYKAGDTLEVPDEVAEVIEDALELVPKPKRYLTRFAQHVDGSISEIYENDLEEIERISLYAFAYCKNITRATIPNNVKAIDGHAFYGCSNLENVVISNNLTSIGVNAFGKCAKLKGISLPEAPPSLENVNAFDTVADGCVFSCKTQESLDAYKVAPNWSTLTGTYSFVVEE